MQKSNRTAARGKPNVARHGRPSEVPEISRPAPDEREDASDKSDAADSVESPVGSDADLATPPLAAEEEDRNQPEAPDDVPDGALPSAEPHGEGSEEPEAAGQDEDPPGAFAVEGPDDPATAHQADASAGERAVKTSNERVAPDHEIDAAGEATAEGDEAKILRMKDVLSPENFDKLRRLQIDDEFRDLIPPQTAAETQALRQMLIEARGCTDPLKVWKNGDVLVLLDGHHRRRLCLELQLPFFFDEVELRDRDAAIARILQNQLGRHNVAGMQLKYLRGALYNGSIRQGARDGATCGEGCHKSESSEEAERARNDTTAQQMAKEYHLNEKTVRLAGAFAKALDAVAEKASDSGKELRRKILADVVKVPQAQLRKMAEKDQGTLKMEVEQILKEGKSPKPAPKSATKTALKVLNDAWAKADATERRAFLNGLTSDQETKTLAAELFGAGAPDGEAEAASVVVAEGGGE